jgi:LacI family transcriptional regulator
MKSNGGRAAMNMRTVAKYAGVSTATVSRVLNGSAAVKPETAEHVKRILHKLKFIPNPIATTLKYGRSNTYGVIVPDLTNPFYPEFLLNFEEALLENDQELLLATTQSSDRKLIGSVRRMLMRHVDGVVLMASEYDTRLIEPLFDHKIPIVTVDRGAAREGAGDVAIDFVDGYKQIMVHLYELGHRHIGFVGGMMGIRTSEARLDAFQAALQHVGITYNHDFIRCGDYRVAGGEAAARSLLKSPRRPTAILTVNDLTAFGVLRALHSSGLSVPSQISVAGFDGIMLSEAVHPSLTTVAISTRNMVGACLKVLEYVKANINKRGLLVPVRGSLIVRESTGPAATVQRQR